MLTIYASTEKLELIRETIRREDRLDEIVTAVDFNSQDQANNSLYLSVIHSEILIPLSWDNSAPPFLLPERVLWSPEILLGLIFHFLQNDQKSWEYLNGTELYKYIEKQNQLKYGIPISSMMSDPEPYRNYHNQGAIYHYGIVQSPANNPDPEYWYKQALDQEANGEFRAFTLRELASLYMDQGRLPEAEAYLVSAQEQALSMEAKQAINLLLVKVWMQQLVVPYQQGHIERIKDKIWETLSWYEEKNQNVQAGLLLMDATHIANISDSYSEALGYIKRAIDIFDNEGLPELAASAKLQKGMLLGTWAQNGNPQFYRPAIESYQQALYVFTKSESPDVFADVQHKLGVLYAEMPDEHKKRGIWAGVASASFHAALEYYTKEAFPYEYASICNNFANAYTKFPPSMRFDNQAKALAYYQEALEVRSKVYPYERAITLLNYLEASWKAGNDESSFHTAKVDDLIAKASEIENLVNDEEMIAEAQRHIENLNRVKGHIEKEASDA